MVVMATNYVAKILKGGKPAEMPVERPTRCRFSCIDLLQTRAGDEKK
jgi:ABC-type uncharacterized transport system substrate-binding protein